MNPPEKISSLKGLGSHSEKALNAIGIHTPADLEKAGAIGAYYKLINAGTAPNMNFLYALVGALENRLWQDVAKHDKGALALALENYREMRAGLETQNRRNLT